MNSSERNEEMIREVEGYRWDAVLLNETWRPAKSEIWETHQTDIYMGARKYENKHGVRISAEQEMAKKESSTLNTSTNGPLPQRSRSTTIASR